MQYTVSLSWQWQHGFACFHHWNRPIFLQSTTISELNVFLKCFGTFWDMFVPSCRLGRCQRWKLANPHTHRCWQVSSDRTNKTPFGTEGNAHYPTRMLTFWHKLASNSSHHQASKNERNNALNIQNWRFERPEPYIFSVYHQNLPN